MINFFIDNFHYLDKNLLSEKVNSVTIVDWSNILKERKKEFKDYYFIVVEEDKSLFIDTYLLNLIEIQYKDNCINLNMDTDSLKNEIIINKKTCKELKIYVIQVQKEEQCLNVNCKGEKEVHVIHENIITRKGHSILNINSDSKVKVYYLHNNMTEQLTHQEILIHNSGNLSLYLLEKEQNSKTKVDIQCYLYQNSVFDYKALFKLQQHQLRDDTIEVIHKESDSISKMDYISINRGMAVSQVNSVIEKEAINCSTHQNIKHILVDEKSKSFSKPNLIIHNPNVIATHGNNMGTIPKEYIFYLQQRGFTEEQAITTIIDSIINNFCNNTIDSKYFKKFFTTN